MQAQRLISSKPGVKKSFAMKDTESAPCPVCNTRQSSWQDESTMPGTSSNVNRWKQKSSNKSGNSEPEGSNTTSLKPIGELSVTEHRLKKFKCVCKFKYKECNFVANSRHEINNHHKATHSKCYCNKCGKACNTPNTLLHHMYSHNKDLPYPCEERFAFSGQLKQHRFKHRTVATFPCSKFTIYERRRTGKTLEGSWEHRL